MHANKVDSVGEKRIVMKCDGSGARTEKKLQKNYCNVIVMMEVSNGNKT